MRSSYIGNRGALRISCLRCSCSAIKPKLKESSNSCSIRDMAGGRLMSRRSPAVAGATNSPGLRAQRLVPVGGWDAEIASEGVEEGRTNIDIASSRHFSRCFIHALPS